jgi:hypothetical protein
MDEAAEREIAIDGSLTERWLANISLWSRYFDTHDPCTAIMTPTCNNDFRIWHGKVAWRDKYITARDTPSIVLMATFKANFVHNNNISATRRKNMFHNLYWSTHSSKVTLIVV